MELQKKNKANLALGLSAAGFLGTLWLPGGFTAGLVHHGFLAATIGGLADWFAVTAIFRKPLGIAYRTDILRRNRKRIMDALVEFTSEDLLSTRNIMQVVRDQDLSALLVDYLEQRGGRERVHQVIESVMLRGAAEMDTHLIAAQLVSALRDGLRSVPFAQLMSELLSMLAEEQHSRRILHSLLVILQQILETPNFQQILLEHVHHLRVNYERDSAGRAFVLSMLDLSDERLLAIFNEKLREQLAELLKGGSQSYASMKAGLETLLRSLGQETRLQEMLQQWQNRQLGQMDLEPFLVRWLEVNFRGENPFWLAAVHEFVDRKLDGFIASQAWQRHFDEFLKNLMESELEEHHNLIPGLIRERLAEFSDDDLVTFIEDKVQDDLQMIRINGAIVGSLVGMGLYILIALAERMWGL